MFRLSVVAPALVAALCGVLAAGYASHWQMYLGYDQFFYVDSVRAILRGDLEGVHMVWAPGYPMAGAVLSLFGLWPAQALVLVSLLAFGGTLVLLNHALSVLLPRMLLRTVVLAAMALLPAQHMLLATPLSEHLFGFLVIGLMYALHDHRSGRDILPAAVVMAIPVVRYAGVPLLLALLPAAVSAAGRRESLGRTLRIAGVALLSLCGLILWNILVTGHLSGSPRFDFNLDILHHVSDVGWAVIGLVSRQGLDTDRSFTSTTIGFTMVLVTVGISLCGLRSDRHPHVRDASLLVLLYLGGVVVMRSIAFFMPLSHPRFIIPILPLLVLVIVSESTRLITPRHGNLAILILSISILILSTVQTMRARMHADPMLPVREAEGVLDKVATSGDTVIVNHAGKSIYRHSAATVRFTGDSSEVAAMLPAADFVVIAAEHVRDGRYEIRTNRAQMMKDVVERSREFNLLHASSLSLVYRHRTR